MQTLSRLAGDGGSQYWDSTSDNNVECHSILVTDDAVFSKLIEWEGDTSTDALVAAEQNLSGNTVPSNALITPRRQYFKGFALTSGKVEIYRGRKK